MEFLTLEQLHKHWQGHRRLTIRTIEAFPDEQLFQFSVAPMRPFGKLVLEVLMVEKHFLHGIVSGDWLWKPKAIQAENKKELLSGTENLAEESQGMWAKLSLERLRAIETDAGNATKPNLDRLLYMLDNEIHHRAQGYVYLRLLGIEPPAFYER
ncbi:MAG: DinB family protein [Trueperaceae bacterium]